jgi:hypothetical protein
MARHGLYRTNFGQRRRLRSLGVRSHGDAEHLSELPASAKREHRQWNPGLQFVPAIATEALITCDKEYCISCCAHSCWVPS